MNNNWKVVLAFIAVFILGTIFGGGFALRISKAVAPPERPQKRIVERLPQVRGEGVQPPLATQLLRRFAENLELTNEQRDKVKPLVQAAETKIMEIRQDSLEETESILRKLQEDFRAELTADQRRKLNRMQQRQNEMVTEERRRRQQQQQGQPQFGTRPNQPPFNPNQPFNPNNPNPQRPNLRPQPGPNGQPQGQFQPPPNQPMRPNGPVGPPPQGVQPAPEQNPAPPQNP
jgi:hypothetical protein